MIGGDPNGVPFHQFCHQEWRDKYGIKPPWLVKDYASLARALKVSASEEIARAAWRAYLASTDPFYQGHSPTKFVHSIDRWMVRVIPKPAPKSKITDEQAAELRSRHDAAVAESLKKYLTATPIRK